jgi:hypothetical protein
LQSRFGRWSRFYFWEKNRRQILPDGNRDWVWNSIENEMSIIFTGDISPKRESKKLNIRRRGNFGGFGWPEVREKKTVKDCQIPIFGFHCVARNMEG